MAPKSPGLARGAIFPTLRDPDLEATFRDRGIVVLDLLTVAEARSLRSELLEVLPDDPGDFFDLFRNNPPELRKQLDAIVRPALEARASEVLFDHDFWSATVLVKPPGPRGEIGLHTDWNMVDETRYRSGLVWVSLDDATPDCGGLVAVPGTNRLDVPYRGHGVHFDFDEPEVRTLIDARTEPVEVQVGQAAIWDNRLLHGSGPNHSTTWRIAAAMGFKPRVAALHHYRPTADGVTRRYTIVPEFFLDYEPFDPDAQPGGPHVLSSEPIPDDPWILTPEDLRALDGASEPPPQVTPPPHRLDSTPGPSGRSPDPAESSPEVLALRWLDLDPSTIADHPTLLADINARRVDGVTIANVFTAEECSAAVASLSRAAEDRHPAMFGTMLGMSLANLGAHVTDARDRRVYFDDADLVRRRYQEAFGLDPFSRVAEVLAPAAGGRRLAAATEGGRQYLAGNIRWMEPGGRALPAHVGNEFQQQRDGSTDHLRAVTRIHDHYSWFVVLQPPEVGGELSVFDLLYESDAPAEAPWGALGRDDTAFNRCPARQIAPEAGQLVIFGGGWRWHRVNRIGGALPRITFGGFAGPSIDGTAIHSWF